MTMAEPLDAHMMDYGIDIDEPMQMGLSTEAISWYGKDRMEDDEEHPFLLAPKDGDDAEMHSYDLSPDLEMVEDQSDALVPGLVMHDIDNADIELVDASSPGAAIHIPAEPLTSIGASESSWRTDVNFDAVQGSAEIALVGLPHANSVLSDPSLVAPLPSALEVGQTPDTSSIGHLPALLNEQPRDLFQESLTLARGPTVEVPSMATEDFVLDPAVVENSTHPASPEGFAPEHLEQHALPSQAPVLPEIAQTTSVESSAELRQVVFTNNTGEIGEYSEEEADPHEIEDGVSIDPPPPVLFSLHTSTSSQQEMALFNDPYSRSGPSSPRLETADSEPPSASLTVILAQQPTLYYQPLTELFCALRGEVLLHVADLMDGELIVDAYDLDLVVSEDNAHARELTLHDLSLLHDGLGLDGPLRIQLRSTIPRFIVRYHKLKDQITRLHVGPAAEDNQAPEQDHEQGVTHAHEEPAEFESHPDTAEEQRLLEQALAADQENGSDHDDDDLHSEDEETAEIDGSKPDEGVGHDRAGNDDGQDQLTQSVPHGEDQNLNSETVGVSGTPVAEGESASLQEVQPTYVADELVAVEVDRNGISNESGEPNGVDDEGSEHAADTDHNRQGDLTTGTFAKDGLEVEIHDELVATDGIDGSFAEDAETAVEDFVHEDDLESLADDRASHHTEGGGEDGSGDHEADYNEDAQTDDEFFENDPDHAEVTPKVEEGAEGGRCGSSVAEEGEGRLVFEEGELNEHDGPEEGEYEEIYDAEGDSQLTSTLDGDSQNVGGDANDTDFDSVHEDALSSAADGDFTLDPTDDPDLDDLVGLDDLETFSNKLGAHLEPLEDVIAGSITPLEDLTALADDNGKDGPNAALPRRHSKRSYHDMEADSALLTELPDLKRSRGE